MIEYVNYNQTRKYAKGLEDGISTSLKARLEFKNEVAPKDVEDVKYRLKWKTIGPLKNYFKEKENLSLENTHSKYAHFKRFNTKFELKANLRRLRLEIKVNSPNDTSIKDMLDLEALNNFILTGQYG